MQPAIHLDVRSANADPAQQSSAAAGELPVIASVNFGHALAKHVTSNAEKTASLVNGARTLNPEFLAGENSPPVFSPARSSEPVSDPQNGIPIKDGAFVPDLSATTVPAPPVTDTSISGSSKRDSVNGNQSSENVKSRSSRNRESDTGTLPLQALPFSGIPGITAYPTGDSLSTTSIASVESSGAGARTAVAKQNPVNDEADNLSTAFPESGDSKVNQTEPERTAAANLLPGLSAVANSNRTSMASVAPSPVQTASAAAISVGSTGSGASEGGSNTDHPISKLPVALEVQTSGNVESHSHSVTLPETREPQSIHQMLSRVAEVPSSQVLGTASDAAHSASHEGATAVTTVAHAQPSNSNAASLSINPYQKLDQISGNSASIMTSSNRIAIGVHDPGLGWVEIRTQSTAGQVAAALMTTSSQTHQALSAQLPSLAQFLSDHEVRVNSLAVEQHAPAGSGPNHGGSGDQQGAGSSHYGEGAQSQGHDVPPVTSPELGADPIVDSRPALYISVLA